MRGGNALHGIRTLVKAKPQRASPVEAKNLPKTIDDRQKGVSTLVTQLQGLYKDQGVVVVEDQKKVIYFCAICSVWAYHDASLIDHLRGKKHKKRLGMATPLTSPPSEKGGSPLWQPPSSLHPPWKTAAQDASAKQKSSPPGRVSSAASAIGESLKRKKASKTKPVTSRSVATCKADILKMVPYTRKKDDVQSAPVHVSASPSGFLLALFSFSEAIGREDEGKHSWAKHLLSSSSACVKLLDDKPSNQAHCTGCRKDVCDVSVKGGAAGARSVSDCGTGKQPPPGKMVDADAGDEQVLLLEPRTCNEAAQDAQNGCEAAGEERGFAAFLRTLSTESSSGGSSSGKGSRRTSGNSSDDEMMEAGDPKQSLSVGEGKKRMDALSRQLGNRAPDESSDKANVEGPQEADTKTKVTAKQGSRRRRQRRGPAGASANRKCFICRQDMHDGQIVGALWNAEAKRTACSSRNTHERFHVFHHQCIADWVVFCRAVIEYTSSPRDNPVLPYASPTCRALRGTDMVAAAPAPMLLPPPTLAGLEALTIDQSGHATAACDTRGRAVSGSGPDEDMAAERSTSATPTSQAGVLEQGGSDSNVAAGAADQLEAAQSLVDGEGALARFDLPLEIFCPECQGTGQTTADGSLEHPRYRLSQVFDWILAMNLARKQLTKGQEGKGSLEGFHTTFNSKVVSLPIISDTAFQEALTNAVQELHILEPPVS